MALYQNTKLQTYYDQLLHYGYETDQAKQLTDAYAVKNNLVTSQPSQPQQQQQYQTQPYQPQQPTQPQSNSNITWNLSSWTSSGSNWTKQPVLTINGQQYIFNTPQEYINKLNELKSGGATGNLDLFASQFQNIVPNFIKQPVVAETHQSKTGTFNAQGMFVPDVPKNVSPQNSFNVGQRVNGPEAIAAAKAAGYTLKNGSDIGSSWPSYEIAAPTNQNQLYQTEYDRIKAQYPNDPQQALQVFKAANPNAPKDFVTQISSTGSNNPTVQPQPTQQPVQNQLYQTEYDRIAAQYPNDPTTALQVFKAANPNAPKDFVPQITQPQQNQEQQSQQFQDMSQLPSNITSSPQWSQLSPDQQALIKLYYSGSQAGTAEQKARIDLALNEAIKVADPWLKEQVNIVKDELNRGAGSIQGDYQSKSNDLQNRVKSIQEDLAYNKENLTLDQQTELSSQLRKYKGDLFNIQQSAAEAGLAFSSPRTTAESNLGAANQDIVQSTQQKYGRALREQEMTAQRNLATLKQGAADLERQRQESLTTIQRGAEKQLGSNTTPIFAGVPQLGGLSGTIPGQQGQYVTNLAGSLLNNPLNQLLK